ncbi:MAG: polyprenyl synthetase family protein [Hyphomicrobiales bacterium]
MRDFEVKLAQIACQVNRVLDAFLTLACSPARRMVEAMRYASLDKGKRLRPFLLVESARLLGGDDERALRVGAALECVHCYSLVHDDLPAMDDDDLRRGRPATHIAFDEATAILAGDALLTLAFEMLADPATHAEATVRAQLVLELAHVAGKNGMIGGQMLDLTIANRSGETSLDDIAAMQSLKTGALFRYAARAGAMLARASDTEIKALALYGDRIGLAFQIADDLLDVESTAETTGKRTGKDSHAGKATFVGVLGVEQARAYARNLILQACAALDGFEGDTTGLRELARFAITRGN